MDRRSKTGIEKIIQIQNLRSNLKNNYPTPYLSLWPHSRENHSNTHNKLLRADSGLILAQNDHGGAMESRQSAARAPKTGQRAGDRRSPARRAGLGLNAAPPQKPIGPPQPYAHLRAKVQLTEVPSEINLFYTQQETALRI